METIVEDLKNIKERIECLDDPCATESYRKLIAEAHFSVEECILVLNTITKDDER